MSCDDCEFYRWYYDHCDKWDCKTDERSICDFFVEYKKSLRERIVNCQQFEKFVQSKKVVS